MNKTILIIGALLVVSIGGFVMYSSNMEMKEMKKMELEKAMIAEKEAMAVRDSQTNAASNTAAMMKGEDSMMMKKDDSDMMKKTAGVYTTYSADKIALAKESKVILFFAANWCPTCRVLDAEITSKGVKDGYVILKADYDTSKELKAKYGVTSQHTLVQVDSSGSQIAKWSGGDLNNIYSKAK